MVASVITFVRLYVPSAVDPAVDPRLIETGSGVGAAVVSVEAVSGAVRTGLPMPMMLLTYKQEVVDFQLALSQRRYVCRTRQVLKICNMKSLT